MAPGDGRPGIRLELCFGDIGSGQEGPRLYFQRVPEPKSVKNRVHLDVNCGGDKGTPRDERRVRVDAQAKRLTGLGATKLKAMEQRGGYWIVMQDPEGNEFCLQ